MKNRRLYAFILAAGIVAAALAGCSASPDNNETTYVTGNQVENDNNGIAAFRPVDCGLPAQSEYEYPFLGLNVKLPEVILEKMTSKEVFAFTYEDYTTDYDISYGVIRFSATTEDDRNSDAGLSADIYGFEEGLEKIGAIGVYEKSVVSQLDELTGCDTHEQFGESVDGAYEYYLSVNSKCSSDLVNELKNATLFVDEMHDFDPNLGYTAFSNDRVDGIDTVGAFSTTDVFGKTYTQDVFADYDLTLVNVFTTWCSPCVEEIPVLEKLRQEYADKGIKLGIVAVVYDIKTASGTDEGALEQAKILYERSEAQFPFLIPDDGNMNDRLTGIESFPESFFVDKDSNVVSEPYIGANTQEDWAKIVEKELADLQGDNE